MGITSSIAAKFAFFPPNPPSYALVCDERTGKLRFDDIPPSDNVEIFKVKTRKRQEIVAMFVRNRAAKLTLLHSHGNAADLAQMHDLYVGLSSLLQVNVFGYDYTGYGCSTGKPTEYNTYADIDAAMESLQSKFNIKPEDTVLYGQSVGSGPTVDLAARLPRLRGIVLHSPILSGVRVLYQVKHTYWFDIFKNIDKIGNVGCPVLILHGTSDEVVHISHGRELWQLCKKPFEPLWIYGGKHCDLEFKPEFLTHLQRFMAHLLENPPDSLT